MSGRSRRLLAAGATFAIIGVAFLRAGIEKPEPSGATMTRAALVFLQTLTPEQKKQASFKYNDPERLDWHYVPRPRNGLPFREMSEVSRKAAHTLIANSLSRAGYDQTLQVIGLEEVLFLLDAEKDPADVVKERKVRREFRNPGKYYISIFDTPTLNGKWGWRLEGHHVSLNFVINNGVVVASTPEFFGANPATLDAGPGRRLRPLGAEEDLARQVLKLCTPEQQKMMVIEKTAPKDVRGANKPQAEATPAVGLAYAQMSADQQKLLGALITEYLRNMPADVSAARRKAIEEAGMDKILMAWWGEPDLNQRHYYRVQGPTFIIEYNNTQDNANHVHSMWRDVRGDFDIPVK